MSDLEMLVTEAALLSMADNEASTDKVEGSNADLSINTRMKLIIHENLIQESGNEFKNTFA